MNLGGWEYHSRIPKFDYPVAAANLDCSGGNIDGLFNVDKSSCESQCSTHPDCTGFSMREQTCYLKNLSLSECDPVNNGWVYFVRTDPDELTQNDFEVLEASHDCPGGNLNDFITISLNECQAECVADDSCTGFSIFGHHCFTKNLAVGDCSPIQNGWTFYAKI